ncbi:MAG: hypothetical protein AAGC65_22280 [Mucilaginibacter sp.]|uniref:hypothetical protein n=1 Tax=Mucilaginibacter sp. TaxID=1882438 RepID=UPI0031A83DAB
MKLYKTKLIGYLTLILLLSIAVNYFLPPNGILLSPVSMSLMVWLILFTKNDLQIFIKSVFCYLCIGLNDIGVKLFAGGIHDWEGQGFITLFLFIGFFSCAIMLLVAVYREQGAGKWVKTISIVAFMLLVYANIQLFQKLGLDARYC